MPIVILRLNDTHRSNCIQPPCCPNCGSMNLRPWGQTQRNVCDIEPVVVSANRIFCSNCLKTFRIYPQGFDRSAHSVRIRRLAALIWLLDLSIRDVVEVFKEQGIQLNRMMIWREGMRLLEELNKSNLLNPHNRISIDKEGNFERRPKGGVVLVLNLEEEKYSSLGTVNCLNPNTVVEWLKPILNDLDIQVDLLGTKEFSSLYW